MVQSRLFLKDEALRKSFYHRQCCVCGFSPCDPAHIKTFGSGGIDAEWAMVPLCRKHHSEQHNMGINSFYGKYLSFQLAVKVKGWKMEDGRLWNDLINS